ncbi:MAG: ATP-dependent endonuclease, partial [Rhodospirillales bacterium]|nr:ATP-dependent endonuclease [Rhodospirillales bacterium]
MMHICHVEISNFRALESVSIPLRTFSVLIGENDVGKTSFLYAREKFFVGKKLEDPTDWFMRDTDRDIRIVVTFKDVPGEDVEALTRKDGTVVVSKVYSFGQAPKVNAILDDESAVAIPKPVLTQWFSNERFHFIPVRRDLAVQFSMNKTALLGKLLRARMKDQIQAGGAKASLTELEKILKGAMDEPREVLEEFLREQMHNSSMSLSFDDVEIDPVEGVSFSVNLSDDRVEGVRIENRGSGTQNNLIIALFRLVAQLGPDEHLILAMEEPENSLHPKAQRQLLSVIQAISQNSQVIVTTHSPVFIDRSSFDSNIILTRTINGNTTTKTFDAEMMDEVRTDLGIRASDAMLKGGGNCAVLVEGRTEEDGFPTWMEMCGMSEFQMGIAIIRLDGSDTQKVSNVARLLKAYDIPCVIVLDRDAQATADDITRESKAELDNIKHTFVLDRGCVEDYFPLDIVADVINDRFNPENPVKVDDFDANKSGNDRLNDFKKVMWEHKAGESIEYLKRQLGGYGTRLMMERGIDVDPEIQSIFE